MSDNTYRFSDNIRAEIVATLGAVDLRISMLREEAQRARRAHAANSGTRAEDYNLEAFFDYETHTQLLSLKTSALETLVRLDTLTGRTE